MTEKNKSEKMTNSSKPVPMKLFAAWEVDRTPSNCIPRLCTLRVTRLKVCGAINETGGGAAGGAGAGAGAVILAARMHSSKRTLRSNDITVPPSEVELDLCFSLQYPHFVKRDGNRLQIMLQRRKKYKNRTILGYKTLAEGVIRMDQVLQRSMDMELELVGVGGKVGAAAGQPIAKLSITGLASTPVDHDTKNNNTLLITERGYSDEEEEGEFSSVEEADDMTYGAPARRRPHRQIAFNKNDLSYTKVACAHDLHERYLNRERKRHSYLHSKHERDSDSELDNASAKRKSSRAKLAQRNLKQKFAALLRRFRVPEELAERGASSDTHNAHTHIDQLFQELESLSCGEGEDSGPDQMDTISIGSTPKPSLRPFFSSSRSLANPEHRHANVTRNSSVASATSDLVKKDSIIGTITESEILRAMGDERGGSEGNSDGDAAEQPVSGASVCSDPPVEQKEDKRSRLFRSATSGGNLTPGNAVSRNKKHSLVVSADRPLSAHDLPVQSPTNLEPRRTVSEQLSRLFPEEAAPPELVAWCPPGAAAGALAALSVPTVLTTSPDPRPLLHKLFSITNQQAGSRRGLAGVVVAGGDAACAGALRAYTELCARRPHVAPLIRFYIVPLGSNTIARYLCSVEPAYAAVFSEGCSEDPALLTQTLSRYLTCPGPINNIPIGEAMIAYRDKLGEEDASQTFVPFVAEVRVGWCEGGMWCGEGSETGSPPARASPPATPDPAPHPAPPAPHPAGHPALHPASHPAPHPAPPPLELQLDYWLVAGRQLDGVDSKVTVKASFRALHVTRHHQHLQITYLTKEKKQKIMRLGKKKERSGEPEVGRSQVVEGVARLICSAKGAHNPLKVFIDGTEWNGVKFFQLSTQWQTHVKTFPVATCGAPLAPSEP